MVDLLIRLSNQLFLGVCCLSIILVPLSIVALLRLLPTFLRAVRFGVRGILILSFRLYSLVLTRLAPLVQQQTGIDVLNGMARIAATVALSFALGMLFFGLTRAVITGWGVGLLVLHGLSVGLAWDDIAEPDGLRLGVKSK
jgi:hypothetical protein